MIVFQDLFVESGGKPIEYKDRIMQLVDRIPIQKEQDVIVSVESVDSEWRQGICITLDGEIDVLKQTIPKAAVLWADSMGPQIQLHLRSPAGEVLIKNVWDAGDGVMHSWHGGAAMIVESCGNRRRYLCNDGHADDNFSELVFTVELCR